MRNSDRPYTIGKFAHWPALTNAGRYPRVVTVTPRRGHEREQACAAQISGACGRGRSGARGAQAARAARAFAQAGAGEDQGRPHAAVQGDVCAARHCHRERIQAGAAGGRRETGRPRGRHSEGRRRIGAGQGDRQHQPADHTRQGRRRHRDRPLRRRRRDDPRDSRSGRPSHHPECRLCSRDRAALRAEHLPHVVLQLAVGLCDRRRAGQPSQHPQGGDAFVEVRCGRGVREGFPGRVREGRRSDREGPLDPVSERRVPSAADRDRVAEARRDVRLLRGRGRGEAAARLRAGRAQGQDPSRGSRAS